MKIEADRPVITEEMIEAGLAALAETDVDACSPAVLVTAIYGAMAGSRRLEPLPVEVLVLFFPDL
jgi:hypothetical protein